MANRRMFAKSIVQSGKFLNMPPTTRLLYYDLGMSADDDGVAEAVTVMRMSGATIDDLRVLSAKGYIKILDDDYVSYITGWKVNNLIKTDRYHEGIYKSLLVGFQDGTQMEPERNHLGTQMEPEVRLGQVRVGQGSSGEDRVPTHTDIYTLLNINDAWRYDVSARRAVTQKLTEYIGTIKPELKCGALMECIHLAMAENGIYPHEIVEIAKASDGIIGFSSRLLGSRPA